MKQTPLLMATLAALCLAPAATAQPPGGQMPAAMQAKMKAWERWGKSHRNVEALQQTLRGLDALERDPATRLSKAQAKTILPLLKTWRAKKVMTDAQARQVNKRITASLTDTQLKRVSAGRGAKRPGGFGGPMPGGPPEGFGGPPPGGPPPGGFGGPPPGGPGGGPPGGPGAFPAPKEYNPLNPATLPFAPERDRSAQELNRLTAALTKRAR